MYQQQPPRGAPYSAPVGSPNPGPEPGAPQPEDDLFTCPECYVVLDGMEHRRKHAVIHYGDEPLPRYHFHDLAAERKGALLGVDPDTLRR